MQRIILNFLDDLSLWKTGWFIYIEKKLRRFGVRFERVKDVIVGFLMARRGTYQRPFLHVSLLVLLASGVLGAPILANAYPRGLPASLNDFTPPSAVLSSLDLSEYGVQTQRSDKPRDQVITYVVEQGDTLGTIAEKFGVSVPGVREAQWLENFKWGKKVDYPTGS